MTRPLGYLGVALVVLPLHAIASSPWAQVPGRPVWASFPARWSVAGDADRTALTGTFERGGTIRLAVIPTGASDTLTAQEWDRLASGYRDVGTPKVTGDAFAGSGHIGEARFELRVVRSPLDTSPLKDVEALTLVVATAIPASGKRELAAPLAAIAKSVRVQWDRPGGGWTLIPGTTIEVREPDVGFRTVVTAESVSVQSQAAEVQVRLGKAEDLGPLLTRTTRFLAPAGITWTATAPFKAKALGNLAGLRTVGAGTVEGLGYRFEVVAIAVPEGVLLAIASSRGSLEAGPETLDLGTYLRIAPSGQ